MITPVQKQDFFSGFDDIDTNGTEMTDMKNKNATYVDVDEGVNFPLLGGPQKHRDYSTIKIDSDHGSGTSRYKVGFCLPDVVVSILPHADSYSGGPTPL